MNLETKNTSQDFPPDIEYPNCTPECVMVSVLVTTYNHESYIEQTLDSILMQETSFPFEICIGEDESGDHTRDICIRYAEKYPDKIRLFLRSRKDVNFLKGQPTGRNNFIKTSNACRGRYVATIEGDDLWTDSAKLQQQFDYLEGNPNCGFVCHYASIIDANGKVLSEPPVLEARYLKWTDFFIGKSNRIGTRHLTTMSRAGLIIKFLDQSWCRDVFAGDRFLKGCVIKPDGCGYVIPKSMGAYRIHGGGIYSLKPRMRKLEHRISDDWIAIKYVLKGYPLLRARLLIRIVRRLLGFLLLAVEERFKK